MSAPRKPPQTGPRTSEKPQPSLMRPGGQPANGKHVPSNVPGHQVHDNSRNVGSNVVGAPGPDRDSDDVLNAPPYPGVSSPPGMDQEPMF